MNPKEAFDEYVDRTSWIWEIAEKEGYNQGYRDAWNRAMIIIALLTLIIIIT